MFKLKYNYVTNTSDEPYIQYWFAKKLEGIAGSTVTGEGSDFNIVSPTERSLKEVVLKGDTTQETLSGKNLIPVNYYNANDGRTSIFNFNLTANTYKLSFDLDSFELGETTSFNVNMQLRYEDNTTYDPSIININTSTTTGRKTYTVVTTKDIIETNQCNIRIAQSNYDAGARVVLSNIQLELGSTATSYEPYCGGIPSPNPDYPQTVNTVTGDQTITITKGSDVQTYSLTLGDLELCKIGDYQDYIYKDGEKWYVKQAIGKVTFTGDETWNQANSNSYFYASVADSLLLPSSSTMPPVLCYYYAPATRNALWDKQVDYGVGLYDGSEARITIRNKDCANTTAFKTWLSTHNTLVYYALATPTDTEITDETLLGQLNTILSDGYLSAGTNTVQTSATGLPIIINIKA